MTVYYYDLFTGTAGTLLTSHTADSGATWPNDADHYYGTGIVTLDGLGGVYQSNTGSSINLSSAAMPSTQNFEVLFSYIRKTSIAANAGLIFLSSPWPTIADCYELFYAEGDGWLLYHTSINGSTNTLLAGPYAGPAFGVTWYMKVDVSTSGGNSTFTVYYSIASTGPFTQLFSYTAATSTDLVAVGTWFYNPSTASTATTGQHIGALTVQNIPALSSATLSGPTQQLFSNPAEFTVGLNEPAGTSGVVVTPSSSNGSDTFQATQGGANVTSIALAAGQLSGMFWLTPGGATGNRTITITTSPTLTCPGSPLTYDALPAATGYTVTGAYGGHQLVPVTWTIALVGGDFAGTITATPSGGTGQCQIFCPIAVTFTGNGTISKTFSFTPLDVDSVTFTFTNSGSLTNPSSKTYTATGTYLIDTFLESDGGPLIQNHTSDSGSSYAAPSAGAISLDGSGGVYLSATGNAMSLSNAAMPSSWNCEFLFELENKSTVAGATAGVMVMSGGGNTLAFVWDGSRNNLEWYLNGAWLVGAGSTGGPPAGTTWMIKLDLTADGPYVNLASYYSTNLSTPTWDLLITDAANPSSQESSLPTSIAGGLYFAGTACSATTGPHIANLTVQDIAPPSPNCQISNAYVASSGQSAAFFFETIAGNAPVEPTKLNYAPSFFRNGVSIGVGVNAWVTGATSCAILQFQNGLQVNPGDIITVSSPASWMTCGAGYAANQVTKLGISNNVGMSCFGTDALAKTFKPGLNISYGGISSDTTFNIYANLRYRLPSTIWANFAIDGYPTSLESGINPLILDFYDFKDSNSLDSTEYPGLSGYYAIGYDDIAYGTSNQCNLTLVTSNSAQATVTQVVGCNNPGSDGIGQFYLFNVQPANGSTVANIPISLSLFNPNGGLAPNISNFYILGPGDFTVPSLTSTTWSFPRPAAPGPLSNQFLRNLANGVGCLRWVDSLFGLGSSGQSNMCEPWELHQLDDFSWNNSNYVNNTIEFTTARPLTTANSPYIYSDFFGSPWTAGSGLGASISGLVAGSGTVSVIHGNSTITFSTSQTGLDGLSLVITGDQTGLQYQIASGSGTSWTLATTWWGTTNAAASWSTLQTTITVASAATEPLFYGLLLLIDSEKMRVRGVSGTSVWVERGSSGTVYESHSSGATITVYSRLAWTQLSTFGSVNTQVVEFLSSSPHGLKAGQAFLPNNLPTMTCTDGSTVSFYTRPIYPTGPNSFIVIGLGATSTAVTLSTSYTLSDVSLVNQEPPSGFAYEAIAIAAAQIKGANLHVNVPMTASDSYCYNVANKTLNNFPAGRRVYVELADEPWNYVIEPTFQTAQFSQLNGYSSQFSWYVIRVSQIRTIFQNVFGSRADEIYAILNNQFANTGIGAEMISVAESNNVIFDAYAVAPYFGPNNSLSASPPVWNVSTIPQMADLLIHDIYYTSGDLNPYLSGHQANISGYNAWLNTNFPGTRHCILYGYEGGYGAGAPSACTYEYQENHDVAYDPVWRIYEKDFYAMMQNAGFADLCLYSYNIYYFYDQTWGLWHWVGQQSGKGGGSDGKFNNRTCLATPGFEYSKASTTNQDQLCVSVRGQAFLEWMQPVQAKKRMLFVPRRFVNR